MPDIKTRNKSKAFWKHGKHKGALQTKLYQDREQGKPKKKNRMSSSIKSLFNS